MQVNDIDKVLKSLAMFIFLKKEFTYKSVVANAPLRAKISYQNVVLRYCHL